jgi:hypothetical protein
MKRFLIGILALVLLAACTPAIQATPDYLALVGSALVERIGQASFGGKVFCAYDVLGANIRTDGADVYVWAFCAEYYLENGALTMGTASSLPVALHMQKSNGQYQVVSHEIPGDGTEYMPTIQRIFPADAIEKMCEGKASCYNERATRLENKVEQEARTYYGLK